MLKQGRWVNIYAFWPRLQSNLITDLRLNNLKNSSPVHFFLGEIIVKLNNLATSPLAPGEDNLE